MTTFGGFNFPSNTSITGVQDATWSEAVFRSRLRMRGAGAPRAGVALKQPMRSSKQAARARHRGCRPLATPSRNRGSRHSEPSICPTFYMPHVASPPAPAVDQCVRSILAQYCRIRPNHTSLIPKFDPTTCQPARVHDNHRRKLSRGSSAVGSKAPSMQRRTVSSCLGQLDPERPR